MSSNRTDTTINVVVMGNTSQQTYQALGLGPVPAGTTADAFVSTVQNHLIKKLTDSWPGTFEPLDTSQLSRGIMGPWTENVGGTAPKCVIQEITLDFNSWGIPNDPPTITAMASEITEQVQANGGLTGVFYGKRRLGGSETLYWGVGYATGTIVDNPEELGIIFIYAAVLGVN